jgi:hypothetical protein
MRKKFIKNQKGYAILFAVVVISAISVITAGLTNTAYKQLILSSLAKDSQSAFYQADTASDCGLYADRVEFVDSFPSTYSCGGYDLTVTGSMANGYTIYPNDENSTSPCFRIDVTKVVNGSSPDETTTTTISSKGYNICNKTNIRTVEREIQISYTE